MNELEKKDEIDDLLSIISINLHRLRQIDAVVNRALQRKMHVMVHSTLLEAEETAEAEAIPPIRPSPGQFVTVRKRKAPSPNMFS